MAKLFLANSRWLIALVLTVVSLVTSSCEFRTPAPVTPQINTNGEMIRKAFFFKNREFKPGTCSDQTFLATWAPIDERGIYAEYFLLNGVPKKMHLNVFWCFTQDALIGYEVNPSFPNQRDHARAVIEIPITKNYYYEPKKDGYQRDTNEMIKNMAWAISRNISEQGIKSHLEALAVKNPAIGLQMAVTGCGFGHSEQQNEACWIWNDDSCEKIERIISPELMRQALLQALPANREGESNGETGNRYQTLNQIGWKVLDAYSSAKAE